MIKIAWLKLSGLVVPANLLLFSVWLITLRSRPFYAKLPLRLKAETSLKHSRTRKDLLLYSKLQMVFFSSELKEVKSNAGVLRLMKSSKLSMLILTLKKVFLRSLSSKTLVTWLLETRTLISVSWSPLHTTSQSLRFGLCLTMKSVSYSLTSWLKLLSPMVFATF